MVRPPGDELVLARDESHERDAIWRASLQKGEWIDLVAHIKFSRDGAVGYVELWLDGARQAFSDGEERIYYPTLERESTGCGELIRTNYRKKGMFPWATVYHDEVKVGNSYEAVAPDQDLQPTQLALTASPTLVDYEGTTTLTGELSTSSGPVPDETVMVWRSTDGGSTWTEDGKAAYDAASKTYKATRSLKENTAFQMRFSGDAPYKETSSPQVDVQARAYLSEPVVTPNDVKRNAEFTVEGYLKPYHEGSTRLYFYYYIPVYGWYYYSSVDAPNARYDENTAKYSVNYELPYAGYWRVKAYHGDASHAETYAHKVFAVN